MTHCYLRCSLLIKGKCELLTALGVWPLLLRTAFVFIPSCLGRVWLWNQAEPGFQTPLPLITYDLEQVIRSLETSLCIKWKRQSPPHRAVVWSKRDITGAERSSKPAQHSHSPVIHDSPNSTLKATQVLMSLLICQFTFPVLVVHGQQRFENMQWKVPEINTS